MGPLTVQRNVKETTILLVFLSSGEILINDWPICHWKYPKIGVSQTVVVSKVNKGGSINESMGVVLETPVKPQFSQYAQSFFELNTQYPHMVCS